MLATSQNFTGMVWRAAIHLLKCRSMGAKPNLHCAILLFVFNCDFGRATEKARREAEVLGVATEPFKLNRAT